MAGSVFSFTALTVLYFVFDVQAEEISYQIEQVTRLTNENNSMTNTTGISSKNFDAKTSINTELGDGAVVSKSVKQESVTDKFKHPRTVFQTNYFKKPLFYPLVVESPFLKVPSFQKNYKVIPVQTRAPSNIKRSPVYKIVGDKIYPITINKLYPVFNGKKVYPIIKQNAYPIKVKQLQPTTRIPIESFVYHPTTNTKNFKPVESQQIPDSAFSYVKFQGNLVHSSDSNNKELPTKDAINEDVSFNRHEENWTSHPWPSQPPEPEHHLEENKYHFNFQNDHVHSTYLQRYPDNEEPSYYNNNQEPDPYKHVNSQIADTPQQYSPGASFAASKINEDFLLPTQNDQTPQLPIEEHFNIKPTSFVNAHHEDPYSPVPIFGAKIEPNTSRFVTTLQSSTPMDNLFFSEVSAHFSPLEQRAKLEHVHNLTQSYVSGIEPIIFTIDDNNIDNYKEGNDIINIDAKRQNDTEIAKSYVEKNFHGSYSKNIVHQ